MFKTAPKIIILALITLATIISYQVAISSRDCNPVIWVTPSLERIGLRDRPGNKTNIKLTAARGEYEAFQIGIQAPSENLTNVNVSVSDLESANNQIIAQENITLYREHYVLVTHPSPKKGWNIDRLQKPEWYADGLIPFVDPNTGADLTGADLDAVPFKINSATNQSIWVDVFVPRNTQAGEYKGKFTVTSDRGKVQGEILLKVWDFELPLKPSLNSAFLLWEQQDKQVLVELLKHKLMPEAKVNPAEQRELIDKYGFQSLRLPFWSGANYENCQMKPAPSIQTIQAAAAQHQSDLLLYVYSVDEIDSCRNLYPSLKQWGKNIHQAGVKHLAVMSPVPELYDAVDIWVLQPPMYEASLPRVKNVMARGDEVWFYTTLVQDNYSPKWQIDFEPINYRIPQGFINQSLGLTGVLYWRADFWTDDPWHNIDTYPHDNQHYPGEGMLIYPGEKVGIDGVVPSMRLKWLREGVEDYEYIQILKELGQKEWALKVARSVGADWQNWTKNPIKLESARNILGEKIEATLVELNNHKM